MKKIKVLNIIPSLQDGGIESLIFRIYKGLDDKKFDLSVYCLANIELNYSYRRFLDIGCKVTTFNFINTNRKFHHIFTNLLQLVKMTYAINKYKPHIVHSQDFFSASITRFSLILSRLFLYKPRKSFVTLHNMQFWLGWLHRKVNKVLSFTTDKIICNSESVYKFSLENDKINSKKYIVVYNGIDTAEYKPDTFSKNYLMDKFQIESGDFLIGNVATFSVRKGHKYLLIAFSELIEDYKNLKLVLVGGKRTHELGVYDEMIQIIADNKIKDKVYFLEPRHDIDKFYNGIDLYVMPSAVEGFGLALAEAMACGKIVIASDIPPFKEIINDGQNGFLFRNKDVYSLKEVMSFVISNYNQLSDIAINARNTIVNKFSSAAMIKKYDELYSIF
ncbi:MAG: glycosyltransferase [Chlorobi bacterium]|nr:glycosyltransferase [Chlorobiota bacterium]